jgi:hypothetical protein
MSAVNLLLSWFQASSLVEDSRLRRLDGIKGHCLTMSEPTVRVFSGRKRPIVSA